MRGSLFLFFFLFFLICFLRALLGNDALKLIGGVPSESDESPLPLGPFQLQTVSFDELDGLPPF